MTLKPVGMYREMFDGRHQELPSLFASFTDYVTGDRDAVIGYLRTAPPVFDVLDVVEDLVDGTQRIRSASSLICDGEWIWRIDSVHYLGRYRLAIPADFLRHVRHRGYRPPETVESTPEFEAAVLAYF